MALEHTLKVSRQHKTRHRESSMSKSVIKRIYVPTHVRTLPSGERVTVPGHYKAPPEPY